MRTRLSVFCGHVIEASWLLALIGVPLFFNIFTNRVFEPDKLTLLRTIVTIAGVAWLIQQIEDVARRAASREPLSTWLKRPMVVPALCVVVAYLVSTAASIVPSVSLWGSYVRLQGAYTTFSYLVLFALLLQRLRTGAQLRRLLSVIVFTSLPIALYGLVQHNGLDPLPWGGDVTRRVTSNMGNAIFVAAYLIMVLPITAVRWIALQREALAGLSIATRRWVGFSVWALWLAQCAAWFALPFAQGLLIGLLAIGLLALLGRYLRAPSHRFALLGIYALTLSAQLATTVYTQSRGPLLGLLAALFVIGLVYLALTRRRNSALAFIGVSLAGLLFLLLMNIPGSPLNRVREIPYAGRMARLLETESGTGRVRLLIWEGSVELVRSDPLRAIIGYGPEAMYVAYNPFYPAELAHYEARNASPDRAHNETFDALIMTGLLGLASYLLVFGALLYHGLATVGLVRSPAERGWFIGSLAAGGLLGVLLPWAMQRSLALAGPGLALGLVGAFAAYLMARILLHALRRSLDTLPEPSWPQLMAIALLGALAGHLVEINVGISIAATRTYLWVYAALLALLRQGHVFTSTTASAPQVTGPPVHSRQTGRPQRAARRRRGSEARRPAPGRALSAQPQGLALRHGEALVSALLLAYILVTMAWDYTTNTQGLDSALAILARSLASPSEEGAGMALMVVGVFGLLALALVAEQVEAQEQPHGAIWWLQALGLVAGIAGGIALIYALAHAASLAPGKSSLGLITRYYGVMAAIGLGMAALLYASSEKPARRAPNWGALAYLLPLVAALLLVNQTNLIPVKADILYKQGLKYDSAGMWDQAIVFYQQAAELAPQQDYYQLFLGRATLERAKRLTESSEREAQFERALQILERARALNPLNTDHTANLARAYRAWGEAAPEGPLRLERFQHALDLYDQATQLSPNNAELYNEWGLVYALMGDQDRALATYQVSLGVDPAYGQTYLLIGDIHFARQDWSLALDTYQRALVDSRNSAYAWSRLAYIYAQQGDVPNAIAANLQVLVSAPNDYVTLRNLAFLYDQAKQPAEALAYLDLALASAPTQDKANLESFREYLAAQIPTGG